MPQTKIKLCNKFRGIFSEPTKAATQEAFGLHRHGNVLSRFGHGLGHLSRNPPGLFKAVRRPSPQVLTPGELKPRLQKGVHRKRDTL